MVLSSRNYNLWKVWQWWGSSIINTLSYHLSYQKQQNTTQFNKKTSVSCLMYLWNSNFLLFSIWINTEEIFFSHLFYIVSVLFMQNIYIYIYIYIFIYYICFFLFYSLSKQTSSPKIIVFRIFVIVIVIINSREIRYYEHCMYQKYFTYKYCVVALYGGGN